MTAVLGATAGPVSNKIHRNVRRLQPRIVKATQLLGNRVLFRKAFEMLQPCEGRLSRTVLRGLGPAMAPGYPTAARKQGAVVM